MKASGNKVKDEYIVVLEDDTRDVPAAAEAHVRATGGSINNGMVWEHAIKGFAAKMNEAQAEAMTRRPGVKVRVLYGTIAYF